MPPGNSLLTNNVSPADVVEDSNVPSSGENDVRPSNMVAADVVDSNTGRVFLVPLYSIQWLTCGRPIFLSS
jgi:hypothetical protein